MPARRASPADAAIKMADAARRMGLDTSLLYEAVIGLANEGLLTARCVNEAARVLLTGLGLPEYYFRHISKEALTRVLRVIATNMREKAGHFVLSGETAYLQCVVEGDIQVMVATTATRDYMERVLAADVAERRWEYYHGRKNDSYTYIIKPDRCKRLDELKPGENPFAFAQDAGNLYVPEETSHRYEAFLDRQLQSVERLVEFSYLPNTSETRIMFHKHLAYAALPVLRRVLSDRGLEINRAYREVYRTRQDGIAAVCSLYVAGTVDRALADAVAADLRAFLAVGQNDFSDLYLNGTFSFQEMLFAIGASFFAHQFIYRDVATDRQIMASLKEKELRDAMAHRICDANHSEFQRKVITDAMRANPDLVKTLFGLFDNRLNPHVRQRLGDDELRHELERFGRALQIRFIEDVTGLLIFRYLGRSLTHILKTNFYKANKRSFAFRLTPDVLDPTVFSGRIHGVFFVLGHHALGTHMRAEDIARGGLRLLRITPSNYENQLDDANLLNYALGPRAQRLKHKDIGESGSKGVIVPRPSHAREGLNAVHDYSEGIMDLILPSPEVVDCLGRPEIVFFGPDEGTAHLMDAVAERARQRGYRHWRTFTTGKSIGLPHDAYGLTTDGAVFALHSHGAKGTELQVDGASVCLTPEPAELYRRLGGRIEVSGMTTSGVMACFRTLVARQGRREEDLNLMMTGGPDGDLGANQIQTYRGRVCLIVDSGAVLFDPDGLDRETLMLLALDRHSSPRRNAAAYPRAKLGPRGFLVERTAKNVRLPDGTAVEDGAFFHRNFLTSRENRRFIEAAAIAAFVPCGGLKDTVNFANVRDFIALFGELRFIVEGANVFFDETAREVIAAETGVLQILDSTANKGGVTSSSLGEVLTGFLLGEDYERYLVDDLKTKFRLARELLDTIAANARAETTMLLDLHAREPGVPLARLSVRTSEQLLALQDRLYRRRDAIVGNADLVRRTLELYIPKVLVDILGMPRIVETLSHTELIAYRDAILTKKLAALALYRYATDWEAFLGRLEADADRVLAELTSRQE